MPSRIVLTRPPRSASARTYVRENAASKTAETRTLNTPPKGGVLFRGDSDHGKKKKGVDEILQLAEELNPAERKALLDRLSLGRATTVKSGELRDVEMWSLAVYEALGEAIGTGDVGQQGPAVVRRTVGSPQAFAPVAEFMHASKMQEMNAVERQAVYGFLARLLVDRSRTTSRYTNVPVSAKSVANAARGISSVFELSFPGYLGSGLARLVARQLIAPA